MAFSGGTFSRTFDCTTDRDNGVKILASKFDTELDGMATGLSTTILKDGTQTCTAAIPFAQGITIADNKTITLGTNSDVTIQYDETTNDSLEIAANVEGAALGIVLKADQGDDAGDEWKLNIADGGTLTLGNDINSAGTYVTHLTITPNATVASSTTAVAGNLTIGGAFTTTGVITGGTLEATTDTAAGDNAAIGYTAAEGLILTGQGSTSDITLKNDADATVFTVPTGTDDILFPDGAKAMFGAGSDLQISHDGSNSLIAEAGTGDLKIGTSGGAVRITANGVTDDMIVANQGGSVTLSHSGSTKLATTSTGIDITGGFDATAGSTIITDDNTTQLTLQSNGTDATEGPRLDLRRNSASPAQGDLIGTIRYLGENSAGTNLVFAEIQAEISDVTDGSVDASLDLYVRRNNILSRGLSLNPTSAIFNEGGNDVDFRVESDDQSNALFLNGNTSNFGINRSPTYELDVGANDTDGSVSGRIIAGTDSGASAIFRIHTQATAGARTSSLYFGDSANGGIGRIEYYHDGDSMRFNTNGSERMRITGGAVEVTGTISSNKGSAGTLATFTDGVNSNFVVETSSLLTTIGNGGGSASLAFKANNTEAMRIDSSGRVLTFKTSSGLANAGVEHNFTNAGGYLGVTSESIPVYINRAPSDGGLIEFRQNNSAEGSISVSGTTVSYNGGHLSRWSQLTSNTRDDDIVKGTVMTNLDQMAEWTDEGVTEENEQLNCMAVSSVEGDANVAGVFVNWDNDDYIYTNDMNVAMTGDMIIRIAQGTTVARGDLLMSAGDGTAKPQGDDIVRSKTIAKVTSINVSHTYDDGSYCVPCVLMAC